MGGRRVVISAASALVLGVTGWFTIPALASVGWGSSSGGATASPATSPTTGRPSGAASSSGFNISGPNGVQQLVKDVLPGLSLLPASPAPGGRVLEIGVGLGLPDPAALQAYYQSENDPSSPQYRRFLTPDEFASRFGVARTTYGRVVSWLRSGGLQVTQTSGAGDWVAASGTVGQLEALFHTTIQSFALNGVSFVANTTAPVVPAGDSIISVVGLNTLQRFSTPKVPAAAHGQKRAQSPTLPGCLPSCDYSPQDLWSLYHMPSSNLGQGQPLAVLGEGQSTEVIANLRQFEQLNKLPTVPVTVNHVGKGPFTDDSNQLEWDLDTQAATGMAPDASAVDLYFSDSLADAPIESLFTSWVNDPNGPQQANASFGECETNPTNPVTGPLAQNPYGVELGDDLEPVAEQTLLQAATEGRTLFTSAGDTGSSCPVIALPVVGAGNGVVNQVVPIQLYPCVSQYAVCVGGTVLWSDGNSPPARATEQAWTFTGGGAGLFQAEPAFQKPVSAVNIPCLLDQNGNPFPAGTVCRGVPDVAAMSGDIADNGYNIVANGAPTVEGGTSLSSPLWVGMWTRIQAAAPAQPAPGGLGAPTYPGLGFAAYPIYRVGEGPAYGKDFFDVTLGVNGLYHAAPGWDYVSGWGVPDVTNLMVTLDGTTTPVNPVVPSAPRVTSACNALWLNPAHTATDILGNSDPQLTLLEGNMAPGADKESLVVKLSVQDLSQTVPTGATAEDWYMTWSYKGTEYFAEAQVGVLPGSAPAFFDGTVVGVGTSQQFQTVNTDTGSFVTGKGGTVEIVVPLAHIGTPTSGSVLSSPAGLTDIEIGIPPNPLGIGLASLQRVDSGGPGTNYTLGGTTGTIGCPLPG